MVALVRPSEAQRTDVAPIFAALQKERELEQEILAHMLAHAAAYREAELLGLTPTDFEQASLLTIKAGREADRFARDLEQTNELVADHLILAEALALSRTERMTIYDAITEVCYLKSAQTRNAVDRARLELQRQAVPALVDHLRELRTLTNEEFQRRVRSLRRLRQALAAGNEEETQTEPTPKLQAPRPKPSAAAAQVEVMPHARREVRPVDRPRAGSTIETAAAEAGEAVTITTTVFTPDQPQRRVLFQQRIVNTQQNEAGFMPAPLEVIEYHTETAPAAHHSLARATMPQLPQRAEGLRHSGGSNSVEPRSLPLTNVEPLSNFANSLAEQLLAPQQTAIPTPAAALNEAFSGGWSRGKLYLLAAPPESGKTTFCAWCADDAALRKIPVLFISFEQSKKQLWLHGIARTARLDSRGIASQRWLTSEGGQNAHVRRQVQLATESYSALARYLNVVEAQPGITVADLRPAIARVRAHYQLAPDAPMLVVIDSILSLATGTPELDFSKETELKRQQIIIALKQLARETETAVLAVTPTSSKVTALMTESGEVALETLRQESWYHSAADAVMLLASNEISGSDQLQLLINRYRSSEPALRRLRQVREENAADPAGQERSVYTRLSVLKNRDGSRSELLLLYQRAFHNFIPYDLLLEITR